MRTTTLITAATALLLTLVATALAAVTVYRNDLAGAPRMAELRRVGAGNCTRSNAEHTMSLRLGRNTLACTFATPVIGKNLELAVTGQLSRKTPRALRTRVAWAVAVRSGERSDYTLTVYPGRRRWLLTRAALGDDGEVARTMLAGGPSARIGGIDKRNRLRIRSFAGELTAWVNERIVARYSDLDYETLRGRQATVSIVADRAARGAVVRYDNITVRVPDPPK